MGSNTGNIFQGDSTYRSSFYKSNDYDISLTRKQLLKITNKYQQKRTRNIAINQLRVIKNAPRHLRTKPEFMNTVRNDLLVLRAYNDTVYRKTKKFPYSSALNNLLVRYIALEYEFYIAQKGDDKTLQEASNRLLCFLSMMLNDPNKMNEKKTKLLTLKLLRSSLSEYKVNQIFCEEIMRKVALSLNVLNSLEQICNKPMYADNIWFNTGLSILLHQSEDNYGTDSDESSCDEHGQDLEEHSEMDVDYAESIVFGNDLTTIKLNSSYNYLSHLKEEFDDGSYDTKRTVKTDLQLNKIEKCSTNNNLKKVIKTKRKRKTRSRMSSTCQMKIEDNLIRNKTAKNNTFHNPDEIILIEDDDDDDVQIITTLSETKSMIPQKKEKQETITSFKSNKVNTDNTKNENETLNHSVDEPFNKLQPECEQKTISRKDTLTCNVLNENLPDAKMETCEHQSIDNIYLNLNKQIQLPSIKPEDTSFSGQVSEIKLADNLTCLKQHGYEISIHVENKTDLIESINDASIVNKIDSTKSIDDGYIDNKIDSIKSIDDGYIESEETSPIKSIESTDDDGSIVNKINSTKSIDDGYIDNKIDSIKSIDDGYIESEETSPITSIEDNDTLSISYDGERECQNKIAKTIAIKNEIISQDIQKVIKTEKQFNAEERNTSYNQQTKTEDQHINERNNDKKNTINSQNLEKVNKSDTFKVTESALNIINDRECDNKFVICEDQHESEANYDAENDTKLEGECMTEIENVAEIKEAHTFCSVHTSVINTVNNDSTITDQEYEHKIDSKIIETSQPIRKKVHILKNSHNVVPDNSIKDDIIEMSSKEVCNADMIIKTLEADFTTEKCKILYGDNIENLSNEDNQIISNDKDLKVTVNVAGENLLVKESCTSATNENDEVIKVENEERKTENPIKENLIKPKNDINNSNESIKSLTRSSNIKTNLNSVIISKEGNLEYTKALLKSNKSKCSIDLFDQCDDAVKMSNVSKTTEADTIEGKTKLPEIIQSKSTYKSDKSKCSVDLSDQCDDAVKIQIVSETTQDDTTIEDTVQCKTKLPAIIQLESTFKSDKSKCFVELSDQCDGAAKIPFVSETTEADTIIDNTIEFKTILPEINQSESTVELSDQCDDAVKMKIVSETTKPSTTIGDAIVCKSKLPAIIELETTTIQSIVLINKLDFSASYLNLSENKESINDKLDNPAVLNDEQQTEIILASKTSKHSEVVLNETTNNVSIINVEQKNDSIDKSINTILSDTFTKKNEIVESMKTSEGINNNDSIDKSLKTVSSDAVTKKKKNNVKNPDEIDNAKSVNKISSDMITKNEIEAKDMKIPEATNNLEMKIDTIENGINTILSDRITEKKEIEIKSMESLEDAHNDQKKSDSISKGVNTVSSDIIKQKKEIDDKNIENAEVENKAEEKNDSIDKHINTVVSDMVTKKIEFKVKNTETRGATNDVSIVIDNVEQKIDSIDNIINTIPSDMVTNKMKFKVKNTEILGATHVSIDIDNIKDKIDSVTKKNEIEYKSTDTLEAAHSLIIIENVEKKTDSIKSINTISSDKQKKEIDVKTTETAEDENKVEEKIDSIDKRTNTIPSDMVANKMEFKVKNTETLGATHDVPIVIDNIKEKIDTTAKSINTIKLCKITKKKKIEVKNTEDILQLLDEAINEKNKEKCRINVITESKKIIDNSNSTLMPIKKIDKVQQIDEMSKPDQVDIENENNFDVANEDSSQSETSSTEFVEVPDKDILIEDIISVECKSIDVEKVVSDKTMELNNSDNILLKKTVIVESTTANELKCENTVSNILAKAELYETQIIEKMDDILMEVNDVDLTSSKDALEMKLRKTRTGSKIIHRCANKLKDKRKSQNKSKENQLEKSVNVDDQLDKVGDSSINMKTNIIEAVDMGTTKDLVVKESELLFVKKNKESPFNADVNINLQLSDELSKTVGMNDCSNIDNQKEYDRLSDIDSSITQSNTIEITDESNKLSKVHFSETLNDSLVQYVQAETVNTECIEFPDNEVIIESKSNDTVAYESEYVEVVPKDVEIDLKDSSNDLYLEKNVELPQTNEHDMKCKNITSNILTEVTTTEKEINLEQTVKIFFTDKISTEVNDKLRETGSSLTNKKHRRFECKSKDKSKFQTESNENTKLEKSSYFKSVDINNKQHVNETNINAFIDMGHKSKLLLAEIKMKVEENLDSETIKSDIEINDESIKLFKVQTLSKTMIHSSVQAETKAVNTNFSEKETKLKSNTVKCKLNHLEEAIPKNISIDLKDSSKDLYLEEIAELPGFTTEDKLKSENTTSKEKIIKEKSFKLKNVGKSKTDQIVNTDQSDSINDSESKSRKTRLNLRNNRSYEQKSNDKTKCRTTSKKSYKSGFKNNVKTKNLESVDNALKHIKFAEPAKSISTEEIVETVVIDKDYNDQILTETCEIEVIEEIIEHHISEEETENSTNIILMESNKEDDNKDFTININTKNEHLSNTNKMDYEQVNKENIHNIPKELPTQIQESLQSKSMENNAIVTDIENGNDNINNTQCKVSTNEVFDDHSIDIIGCEEVVTEEIDDYEVSDMTVYETASFIDDKSLSGDCKMVKDYNTLDDFATIALECGEINKMIENEQKEVQAVQHQEITNHSIDVILSNTDIISDDKSHIKTKAELKSFLLHDNSHQSTMILRSKSYEERLESSIFRRFSVDDKCNSGIDQQNIKNSPIEVCLDLSKQPELKIRKCLDDTKPLKSPKKQLAFKHFQNLKNEMKSDNIEPIAPKIIEDDKLTRLSKISPKKRWASELELNEKKNNETQQTKPVKCTEVAPIQKLLQIESVDNEVTTINQKSDQAPIDTTIKLKNKAISKERQSRKKHVSEIKDKLKLFGKSDRNKNIQKSLKGDGDHSKPNSSKHANMDRQNRSSSSREHRSESRSSVESNGRGIDKSKKEKNKLDKYDDVKSKKLNNKVQNSKKEKETSTKRNKFDAIDTKLELKDETSLKIEKNNKTRRSKSSDINIDTKVKTCEAKLNTKDKKNEKATAANKLNIDEIKKRRRSSAENSNNLSDSIQLKKIKNRKGKETTKLETDNTKHQSNYERTRRKSVKIVSKDIDENQSNSDTKNKKSCIPDVMMTTRSRSKDIKKEDSTKVIEVVKSEHDLRKRKISDVEKEIDDKIVDISTETHDLRKRKTTDSEKVSDDKSADIAKETLDLRKRKITDTEKAIDDKSSDIAKETHDLRKKKITDTEIAIDDQSCDIAKETHDLRKRKIIDVENEPDIMDKNRNPKKQKVEQADVDVDSKRKRKTLKKTVKKTNLTEALIPIKEAKQIVKQLEIQNVDGTISTDKSIFKESVVKRINLQLQEVEATNGDDKSECKVHKFVTTDIPNAEIEGSIQDTVELVNEKEEMNDMVYNIVEPKVDLLSNSTTLQSCDSVIQNVKGSSDLFLKVKSKSRGKRNKKNIKEEMSISISKDVETEKLKENDGKLQNSLMDNVARNIESNHKLEAIVSHENKLILPDSKTENVLFRSMEDSAETKEENILQLINKSLESTEVTVQDENNSTTLLKEDNRTTVNVTPTSKRIDIIKDCIKPIKGVSLDSLVYHASSIGLKEDDQIEASNKVISNDLINEVLKSSEILEKPITVDKLYQSTNIVTSDDSGDTSSQVSISQEDDQINLSYSGKTVCDTLKETDRLNTCIEGLDNHLISSTHQLTSKIDTLKSTIEESHEITKSSSQSLNEESAPYILHTLKEDHELQSLEIECTEVSITTESHPMEEVEELEIHPSKESLQESESLKKDDADDKITVLPLKNKENVSETTIIDSVIDNTLKAPVDECKTNKQSALSTIDTSRKDDKIKCHLSEVQLLTGEDNLIAQTIKNSESISCFKRIYVDNVTEKVEMKPIIDTVDSVLKNDENIKVAEPVLENVDVVMMIESGSEHNIANEITLSKDKDVVEISNITNSKNHEIGDKVKLKLNIKKINEKDDEKTEENILEVVSIKSNNKICESKSSSDDISNLSIKPGINTLELIKDTTNISNISTTEFQASNLDITNNKVTPIIIKENAKTNKVCEFKTSNKPVGDSQNDIDNSSSSITKLDNELINQTKNKKGGVKRSREVDTSLARKDKINKRPCSIEDIIKDLVDKKQIGITNRTEEKKTQNKSILNLKEIESQKDSNSSKLILNSQQVNTSIVSEADTIEVLTQSEDGKVNIDASKKQEKSLINPELDNIPDKICITSITETSTENSTSKLHDVITNQDLENDENRHKSDEFTDSMASSSKKCNDYISENKGTTITNYLSLSKNNEVEVASIQKPSKSEVKILSNDYKLPKEKSSEIIEELNDNLVDKTLLCNTANQLDIYSEKPSDCLISKKKSPNVIVERLPQFNDQTPHSTSDTSILKLVPAAFESLVESDDLKSPKLKDSCISENLLANELISVSVKTVLPTSSSIGVVENQVLTSTVSLCNSLNTSSVSFVSNLHVGSDSDCQATRSDIDTIDVDETPLCEKVRACGSILVGTERIQDPEQVTGIGGPFLGGQVLKKSTKSSSKDECNKIDNKQQIDENKCQFSMEKLDYQLPEQDNLVFDCLIPSGSGDNMFVHDICKVEPSGDEVFDKVMSDDKLNEFLSNSLKDLNILTGVQRVCKDISESDSLDCSSDSMLPEDSSTSNESTINSTTDFAVDSLVKLQASSARSHSFPLANMGFADMDTISFNEELSDLTWNQLLILQKKSERWSPDSKILSRIAPKASDIVPQEKQKKDELTIIKEKPSTSQITFSEKKQKTKTKNVPTNVKLKLEVTEKINSLPLRSYERTRVSAPKKKTPQSPVKHSTSTPKSFLIHDVLNMTTPTTSRCHDLPILTKEVIQEDISQENSEEIKSKKPAFVKTINPTVVEKLEPELEKRNSVEKSDKVSKPTEKTKISSDDDSTDEEIFKESTTTHHIMTTKQMSDLFDEVKKKNVNDLPFVRSSVYEVDKTSKKRLKPEFIPKDSRSKESNGSKDKNDIHPDEPKSNTTDSKQTKNDAKKICYVNPIVRPTRQTTTSTISTPVNRVSTRYPERSIERNSARNSERINQRNNERSSERNIERSSERNNERSSERNNERSSERNNERTSERSSERNNERTSERSSERNNERSSERISRSNREIYQSDRYLRRSRSPSRSRRRNNDPYYNDLPPPIRHNFSNPENNRGHYSGSSTTRDPKQHLYFTEMMPMGILLRQYDSGSRQLTSLPFSHFEDETHRSSNGRHRELFDRPIDNREHNHCHYGGNN